MSAMYRSDFKRQLEEGLNAVFGLEYRRYPEIWKQVFETNSSRKAEEKDVLMAGLGSAPVKAEGSAVEFDSGYEAWQTVYRHETIALAFAITEEAMEDNLYGDLGSKYSKALARSMQHTKEIKGASIFNNSFTAGSYAGGDGVALCSASHPYAGGGTWSNTLGTPADLSETSLEQAINQIGDFEDERGIPVNASPVKLVINHYNQFNATRILKSVGRVSTADNDLNAMKAMGMLQADPVVWRYITDQDAWWLVTDVPDGLKYFNRKGMQRKVDGSFDDGNMRYKARERYSFGFTDPRAVFGSQGAA